MKKRLLLVFLGAAILVYVMVAQAVFALRHPWATPTERLSHISAALRFEHVPYEQMRPR